MSVMIWHIMTETYHDRNKYWCVRHDVHIMTHTSWNRHHVRNITWQTHHDRHIMRRHIMREKHDWHFMTGIHSGKMTSWPTHRYRHTHHHRHIMADVSWQTRTMKRCLECAAAHVFRQSPTLCIQSSTTQRRSSDLLCLTAAFRDNRDLYMYTCSSLLGVSLQSARIHVCSW